MTEQVPADQCTTPRTDASAFDAITYDADRSMHVKVVHASFARELERELTEQRAGRADDFLKHQHELCELRRSLRREENAREVLAETNQRLVAEIKSLGGGYTKVSQ